MKTNLNILPILCFLLLWSCKSGNASSQTKNEVSQDTIKTFTLPAIPQIMVAPEQRAEFLVKHYWDNVNFADTNYYGKAGQQGAQLIAHDGSVDFLY